VSGHSHDQNVPRAALIGAGVCVGATLLLTGAVAVGILPRPVPMQEIRIAEHMPKLAQRDLQFLDQPDGSVLIRDVTANAVATTITPGTKSGFIRGVLRGLARDRHLRGLGPEQPFRLILWQNQKLSLEDLATGRIIELNGFGDTNRDAFLTLLQKNPKPPEKEEG
jgi:putative photosynthetic complex assembly protein